MTPTPFRPFLVLTLASAIACGDEAGATSTRSDRGDMAADSRVDGPPMRDADVGNELGPDVRETCTGPDGTLGQACSRDADCNDFCFCNGAELCRGSLCVAGDPPCADDVECTLRACDEDGDRCGDVELRDELCDDGDFCTTHTCDLTLGCITRPVNCDDGDTCTIDSCDSELGCQNPLRDLDGDGFPDSRCTTGLDADCRDDRPDINPGAAEICDNLEDDDCDGEVDVLDPDCTPTNDTCSTAMELASSGFFGFGTTGLSDDYDTQCELRGDPLDAVFFFDVLVESDLSVEVAFGPDNTVLELRGPGDLGVCEDDAQASADGVPCERTDAGSWTPDRASIEQNRLAPGRYYLIVETPVEDLGSLDFRLTTSPPPP